MIIQLGQIDYADLGFWDKLRLILKPLRITHNVEDWTLTYYKIYKNRKVIIAVERYH